MTPDGLGRTSGFRALRDGRIYLRCPKCGRKQSNMPRMEFDPKRAVLAEIFCPKCGNGGKDCETSYYNAKGQPLDPETGRVWR